jgi:hypothetical protein
MDGRFFAGFIAAAVAMIVLGAGAMTAGVVLGPIGERLGGSIDNHLRGIVTEELRSHGVLGSSSLPPPGSTRYLNVNLQLRSGTEDTPFERSVDWFLATDKDHVVRLCKWAAGAVVSQNAVVKERWECEEPYVWQADEAKWLRSGTVLFDVDTAHVTLQPPGSHVTAPGDAALPMK